MLGKKQAVERELEASPEAMALCNAAFDERYPLTPQLSPLFPLPSMPTCSCWLASTFTIAHEHTSVFVMNSAICPRYSVVHSLTLVM